MEREGEREGGREGYTHTYTHTHDARARAHTHTDGRAVEAAICSTISAMKPIFKVYPINTRHHILPIHTLYARYSVLSVFIHVVCMTVGR